MNVKFELIGAAELEKRLKEFGPRFTTNASGKALRAMAKPIVQRAKELVPVRRGALRKSITTKIHRARHGERTIDIGFRRPTSRRAHLTEFGTVHSAAHPFMRPALDTRGDAGFREMQRVLGEALEREAVSRGTSPAEDIGED